MSQYPLFLVAVDYKLNRLTLSSSFDNVWNTVISLRCYTCQAFSTYQSSLRTSRQQEFQSQHSPGGNSWKSSDVHRTQCLPLLTLDIMHVLQKIHPVCIRLCHSSVVVVFYHSDLKGTHAESVVETPSGIHGDRYSCVTTPAVQQRGRIFFSFHRICVVTRVITIRLEGRDTVLSLPLSRSLLFSLLFFFFSWCGEQRSLFRPSQSPLFCYRCKHILLSVIHTTSTLPLVVNWQNSNKSNNIFGFFSQLMFWELAPIYLTRVTSLSSAQCYMLPPQTASRKKKS